MNAAEQHFDNVVGAILRTLNDQVSATGSYDPRLMAALGDLDYLLDAFGVER